MLPLYSRGDLSGGLQDARTRLRIIQVQANVFYDFSFEVNQTLWH